ncbi:MAG: hypothetical protein H8D45_02600 [Bacteroidetes bacterium]|nr:hypothetical protein [Bacteroidota bacterium]
MKVPKKNNVIEGLEDIRYVLLELEKNPKKLRRLPRESELVKRKDGKIMLAPKREMKNIVML